MLVTELGRKTELIDVKYVLNAFLVPSLYINSFTFEQPLKAELPMLVTEFPIVTEVRPEQSLKAPYPMLVTELGIVTEVRPEQLEKASLPMLVTELGIVTEVRLEQYSKANIPMFVTELGIVTEVRPEQLEFVAHIDNQRVVCNTVEKSCCLFLKLEKD